MAESLPISYDEKYKFDYDARRGFTFEFSTPSSKKII
jgi:hypothetical protein